MVLAPENRNTVKNHTKNHENVPIMSISPTANECLQITMLGVCQTWLIPCEANGEEFTHTKKDHGIPCKHSGFETGQFA